MDASGRRAQAARNDELILEAAREVFVANPSAPIADVAKRAGVGISALYRRYPSKEDLLRELCADWLRRYISAAAAAGAPTSRAPSRRRPMSPTRGTRSLRSCSGSSPPTLRASHSASPAPSSRP